MSKQVISISTGTIIRAFMVVLFAYLFLYLSSIVVMLLVAVVLASAIEPWIVWGRKLRLGRGASVSLIFLSIIMLMSSIFYFLIPPLAEDIVAFVKHIPEILQKLTFFGKGQGLTEISLYFESLAKDLTPEKVIEVIKNIFLGGGSFFEVSSAFISGVINIGLTFVLAFYLAAEDQGVYKFLRIVIPTEHEVYVEDLWARAQVKFAHWLRGQLILSLLMAILVFVGLTILGVPYAALFGVFAFFGELVPMVGFALAAIPGVLAAFVAGGAGLMLITLGTYVVINFLENHVFYPAIMNKAVGVPSVIIILAVLIGAELAGIWGVILAVPISAVFMELANDLQKKKHPITLPE